MDFPTTTRGTARVSDLKAAPYNPRKISPQAMAGLTASLARFGIVQDVVVNKRTGHIVGGHQRVNALKLKGVDDVPVVWVDLPLEEERALNVALNNPAIGGEWDETLGALLEEIKRDTPTAFEELRLDALSLTLPPPSGPPTDPSEEWEGMPEFEQEDKTAFRSLVVHFKNQEDVDEFATLVGQTVTPNTRSLWVPQVEIETYADKKYDDE